MQFQWDETKNAINKKKHGISFELASLVFADPYHVSVQDRHVKGEERWQTIGQVQGRVLLLVAHTVEDEAGEIIRLISARPAEFHEKRRYQEENYYGER